MCGLPLGSAVSLVELPSPPPPPLILWMATMENVPNKGQISFQQLASEEDLASVNYLK